MMWVVQNDVYIEFDFEDHMVYALIFVNTAIVVHALFPLSLNPQTPPQPMSKSAFQHSPSLQVHYITASMNYKKSESWP